MALTELQLPGKQEFYAKLRGAASQMNANINAWRDLSEFIGFIDTNDLDQIGVAAGQLRSDLGKFRQAILDVLSLWDGNAVTPVDPPGNVIDKIRDM